MFELKHFKEQSLNYDPRIKWTYRSAAVVDSDLLDVRIVWFCENVAN
jgi:hypothetical protein